MPEWCLKLNTALYSVTQIVIEHASCQNLAAMFIHEPAEGPRAFLSPVLQTIAKNSKRFGIMVSSKPGQKNLEKAVALQKGLREQGKEAAIIYMDEIRAEHINNYSEAEILVNTACPRIAVDGINGIDRPILTINETEVVLELRRWEELWGNSYME